MLQTYIPILILVIFATAIALVMVAASLLLGRRTRLGKKGDPYECGVPPTGNTKDPVPVKFFLIAISFILFDIEVIFLLPWAVVARDLGGFGFAAIAVFVSLLLVGYVYELGKGALKWD